MLFQLDILILKLVRFLFEQFLMLKIIFFSIFLALMIQKECLHHLVFKHLLINNLIYHKHV
jgi:hypothetical protein